MARTTINSPHLMIFLSPEYWSAVSYQPSCWTRTYIKIYPNCYVMYWLLSSKITVEESISDWVVWTHKTQPVLARKDVGWWRRSDTYWRVLRLFRRPAPSLAPHVHSPAHWCERSKTSFLHTVWAYSNLLKTAVLAIRKYRHNWKVGRRTEDWHGQGRRGKIIKYK